MSLVMQEVKLSEQQRPARRRLTHGHARRGIYGHAQRSPTYGSWQAMRQRCLNTAGADYPRYGGRGITICQEWQSFERFLADMGERPEGRLNNDGPYAPDNCAWETPVKQAANRRLPRGRRRRYCLRGHDTLATGRDGSGTCRACRRKER